MIKKEINLNDFDGSLIGKTYTYEELLDSICEYGGKYAIAQFVLNYVLNLNIISECTIDNKAYGFFQDCFKRFATEDKILNIDKFYNLALLYCKERGFVK